MSEQHSERLDDVLDFLRVIWGLDHALQSRGKAMIAELGITGPQRLALRIIDKCPGISSGELSELLHLHPSTLTGVLDRLERRRLVRRTRDPHDGRRALFESTKNGTDLLAIQEHTVEAVVRKALVKAKPEALKATRELLAELTVALEGAPAPRRRR